MLGEFNNSGDYISFAPNVIPYNGESKRQKRSEDPQSQLIQSNQLDINQIQVEDPNTFSQPQDYEYYQQEDQNMDTNDLRQSSDQVSGTKSNNNTS